MANSNTEPQNAVKWYAENILTYMEFTGKVEFLTKEILINRKLKTYDVKARTKSLESIRSKLQEKGGIEEIKDIVGVRVIAYEKSDISKICDCIEEAFHVLDTKSYPEEAEDESQYKSKHFKCKLPDDRIILPEYGRFGGIIFEIQVRTLLQHAWAEIGHDKNYKFSRDLPPHVKNRFESLSLELGVLDDKLAKISKELDEYTYLDSLMGSKGLNILINNRTLRQYMLYKLMKYSLEIVDAYFGTMDYSQEIVTELEAMGVKNLKQLDALMTRDFIESYFRTLSKLGQESNYLGFIRHLMIVKYGNSYLDSVMKRRYNFDEWEAPFLKSLGASNDTVAAIQNRIR